MTARRTARTAAKSTARKTTSRKGPSRSKRRTRSLANPIDDALARLERDIPRLLRQLRSNVQDLQGQVDRARADGEKRWRDAERKIKKDATQLRRGLEKRLESAIVRIRRKGKSAKTKASQAMSAAARAARSASASKPRKGTRKRSA